MPNEFGDQKKPIGNSDRDSATDYKTANEVDFQGVKLTKNLDLAAKEFQKSDIEKVKPTENNISFRTQTKFVRIQTQLYEN